MWADEKRETHMMMQLAIKKKKEKRIKEPREKQSNTVGKVKADILVLQQTYAACTTVPGV